MAIQFPSKRRLPEFLNASIIELQANGSYVSAVRNYQQALKEGGKFKPASGSGRRFFRSA